MTPSRDGCRTIKRCRLIGPCGLFDSSLIPTSPLRRGYMFESARRRSKIALTLPAHAIRLRTDAGVRQSSGELNAMLRQVRMTARIAAMVCIAMNAAVHADTVNTVDGARLVGTIDKVTPKEITLKTSYAGTL